MLIRDYLPLLRDAIGEARDAGLHAGVDILEEVPSSAFTTSSEMVQEHGLAIRRFLKATRYRLPPSAKKKLLACLNETALASTGWRALIVMMKRPDHLC